ncbi:MAG: hypothetical protein V4584_01965 [Verrucomicrobiota bacterium]
MDEKDVFCVACGEGIVINLDLIDQEIECPACHTRLRLDEADDDSGQNDIEWSPEVDITDATRVFGNSAHPEPGKPADHSSTPALAPIIRKRRVFNSLVGISSMIALPLMGWFLLQEVHRADQLEKRLDFLESQVIPMKSAQAASDDMQSKAADLEGYLDELDDTISQIATVLRLQNATSLLNEYSIQSNQKTLIRQEGEFGKLALKVAMVEHEVADKSRHAKEAFELSVKQRKEAEQASIPIRKRIKDLEAQKNVLFAQYRAGSIAKRPPGVLSSRRAAGIMKDYETKAAPLLAQIQSEISRIRESIEAEEAKIDQLFQN